MSTLPLLSKSAGIVAHASVATNTAIVINRVTPHNKYNLGGAVSTKSAKLIMLTLRR